MQPITPQVGGGRIRLAGLYHNMPKELEVTYIGTYDWQGEKPRDEMIYENLREICIPLSDEHFKENEKLTQQSGFNAIDMMFNKFGFFSNEYLQVIKKHTFQSDIVIFSHPWVYPLVKDILDHKRQTIIYDSQNHEGLLRYELYQFVDNPTAKAIIRNVVTIEYQLSKISDLILTCSVEDSNYFADIYELPKDKIKLVSNGVFFEEINQYQKILQKPSRKKALFMGSNYAPNVEAVRFIIDKVAPKNPEIEFIIAGGVCSEFGKNHAKNIKLLGRFAEEDKSKILHNADIAINPMFSGSGTNIKMFDFMAANLPIISTAVGARGIVSDSIKGIVLAGREEFSATLKNWNFSISYQTQTIAKRNFSFKDISHYFGHYINSINRTPKQEIFILSTWNISCGIADHVRQLSNELYQTHNVSILANRAQHLYASNITKDIKYKNIYPVWSYDNIFYRESQIDIPSIVSLVKNKKSLFILHYHKAFFSTELLLKLLTTTLPHCKKLILTLHHLNTKDKKLLNFLSQHKEITVVVHNELDAIELKKHQINPLTFFLGIPNIVPIQSSKEKEKEKEKEKTFTIGGFGFMREHKGIFNIIQSIKKMNNLNIHYRGLHTLVEENSESQGLLERCQSYIKEHQLSKNIQLTTNFLEIEEIIEQLSHCDIILLPYDKNNEGSSASASTAFATHLPICVTKAHIFNSISPYTYQIEGNSINNIITAIELFISDQELYEKYQKLALEYSKEFNISKTAENYLKLIGN